MYKNVDELPVTFGPTELMKIFGVSRNKAYELVNSSDFPKFKMGRRIIISKKHFLLWLDNRFSDN